MRVQGGMENILGEPELAAERWEHALAIARVSRRGAGRRCPPAPPCRHGQTSARRPGGRTSTGRSEPGDSSSQRLPKRRNTGADRTRRHRAGRRPTRAGARAPVRERAHRRGDRLSLVALRRPSADRFHLPRARAARRGRCQHTGGPRDLGCHTRPPSNRRRAHSARRNRCRFRQSASSPGRCSVRPRPRASERRRSPWFHAPYSPERVLAHADAEFEGGRAEGRELSLEAAVALGFGARSLLDEVDRLERVGDQAVLGVEVEKRLRHANAQPRGVRESCRPRDDLCVDPVYLASMRPLVVWLRF